ncbi:MAG: LysM peptidoglycan-binding domain-containing protein, partial [Gammaproteobacteria bacterium]|nr:LysM peptidoglycan-binding domain-containing protein [Gammaproteobacteria bacterium]
MKRRRISRRRSPQRVSVAAILGGACSLCGGSAVALELGDIQVESSLGQPLRASIGFSLNPNEQMFDFCVRLSQSVAGGPIPSVSRADVSVVGNRIVFTGDTAIKDPLLNMQVVVDCPYTPQLTREYTLVVDPIEFLQNEVISADAIAPSAAALIAQTAAAAPPEQSTEIADTAGDGASVAVTSMDRSPIAMNAEYRVQSGDSVSAIAARIEGRTNSLQSAIALLVSSNPGAFLDGDAARLMAGSLLTIPPMTEVFDRSTNNVEPTVPDIREYASEPAQAEPETVASATPPATVDLPVAEPEEVSAIDNDESQPAEVPLSSVTEEVVSEPIEVPAEPASAAGPAEETVATRTTGFSVEMPIGPVDNELRPGDVIVSPVAESTATETTTADTPVIAAPAVGAADSSARGNTNSWTWLTWPVGG